MSEASDGGSATAGDYTLGHSAPELERLIQQGRFLGDLTEHLLRLAGLGPGMHVLDVGCGTGDVCLLLAGRLVGPEGAVTGVDVSAEAIAVARERTRSGGLANVEFIVADAAELTLDQPVDAVVGRLVLTHLTQPAALVRRLLSNLRPGGVVVFQEPDLTTVRAEPPCPLLEATIDRIAGTIARAGGNPRSGLRLRTTFMEAGLPAPRMILEGRVDSEGESPVWSMLAQQTRTLLPVMERFGLATAEEVDVETLAARLREEATALDAVQVFPFVGAWACRQA